MSDGEGRTGKKGRDGKVTVSNCVKEPEEGEGEGKG